ncbi:non-reducing end alpha-L-arabinofuranosidase family hydrolase [Streptomyces sp. NPDC050147]|uniref:non-reducing end alpha-L-arabinofuranosidase family hydrolase n=1 Tax=Streptomyces sp. NPDC050147 TaxID=3155513 RepID=UPI003448CA8A
MFDAPTAVRYFAWERSQTGAPTAPSGHQELPHREKGRSCRCYPRSPRRRAQTLTGLAVDAALEATSVYQVADSNQYLLLQEAIGSAGRHCFHSFTSPSLTSAWTPPTYHRERTLRRPKQRHLPRRHLGARHQPRRNDPRLQRSDPDHQHPPTAVRLPGHGPGGNYRRLPWRMRLLPQTNSPLSTTIATGATHAPHPFVTPPQTPPPPLC